MLSRAGKFYLFLFLCPGTGALAFENGLYLSKKWLTVADFSSVRQLSKFCKEYQIKYIFVRGPNPEKDGTLRISLKDASRFTGHFKNVHGDALILLWIGGRIDGRNAEFRYGERNFVENFTSSVRILSSVFDGIHLDIEPLRDSIPSLMEDFLKKVKASLSNNILSSALPNVCNFSYPSCATEEKILPFVMMSDQIVIMAYDTGIYSRAEYINHVVSQIERFLLLSSRNPFPPEILLGVPTYDELTPLHNPKVENLENSLLGFRKAVTTLPIPTRALRGIAIYANWTTDMEEWMHIRKFLKKY